MTSSGASASLPGPNNAPPHVDRPHGIDLQHRHKSKNMVVEDDVRRFACDRCRSQKLRCERTQVSLKIPLKSIPCKRCMKMGIRCTTNPQTRPGDSVRRISRRPRSTGTHHAHHDDSAGSDDQDEPTGRAQDREMMEIDFQPDDFNMTAASDVVEAAATVHSSPNRMRIQTTPATTRRTSTSPHLHLNPLPTPALSESNPMQDQDYQMAQMLQEYVTVPSGDDNSNLDPELFQDMNFDMSGGFSANEDSDSSWHDLSNIRPAMISGEQNHHQAMVPASEPSVPRRDPHPQHPQHQEVRRTQPSSIDIARPVTASSDPPIMIAQARMLPRPQHTATTATYLLLAQQLSALTNGIFEDIAVQSSGPSENDTPRPGHPSRAETTECPLQKVLARLDEVLTLLDGVPLSSHSRQGSIDDSSYDPYGPPTTKRPPNHTRSHSDHGSAPPPPQQQQQGLFLVGDSDGLARLSFLTALTSTYTSILQAYHHVFSSIQQASATLDDLVRHLPSFHLAGTAHPIRGRMQVHLTLAMALEELNRLEDQLKRIIVEHQGHTGDAEICCIAVLSSLIDDDEQEGGSMSASACVRGTIDALRRMLSNERK